MHFIPEPITFNPLKHHLNFIKHKIKVWHKLEGMEVEKELLTIGNNLLDLYTGELNVMEICKEIQKYFTKNHVSNQDEFIRWLKPYEYKKIMLSDKSVWIIKQGDNPERFIHIHPGKNSVHTVRMRATTLKTAIAIKFNRRIQNNNAPLNLAEVNRVRIEYLSLSPVKHLQPHKGISKVWQLF